MQLSNCLRRGDEREGMVSKCEWKSADFIPKKGSGLLGQLVFLEPTVGLTGKGINDPFVYDEVTQSLVEWA